MSSRSKANVFEIANRAVIASTEVVELPDIALELTHHKSSDSTNAHQISNISGLQSALDGKQNIISGHSGTLTIVTSVDFVNSTFETAKLNIVNGIITKIN